MRRRLAALASLALLALSACDRPAPPPVAAAPEASLPAPAPAPPPSEFLEHPFTAEEIRDEWIPGFTLEVQMSSPAGDELQRWTVVGADAEGADIEYAPSIRWATSSAGRRSGAPPGPSSATTRAFPAANATRQEATRSTALGELDGWLYTVRGAAAGEVTELFFARSLPGAPVEMAVMKDGEVVSGMSQIARRRPE